MIREAIKVNNINFSLLGIAVIIAPIINILPFGINISFSDCILFLAIYLLILKYVAFPHSINTKLQNQISFATGLIIFGYLISSFTIQDSEGFYFGLIQYIFVLVILPYLIFNTIDSREKLIKMIYIYLFGVFLLNVVNLSIYYEFLLGKHMIGTFRFSGTLVNPNQFAKFQIITIVSFLVLLFKWKANPIKKLFIIINIIISLFLIATTGSFGGILFLIVSLIQFIIIHLILYKRKRLFIILGIFIFLLISINLINNFNNYDINKITYLPKVIPERLLVAKNLSDMGSGKNKLSQIFYGYNHFVENIFIGVGLENYKYYNKPAIDVFHKPMSAHSFYIAIATEGGIFTVIGYLLYFTIIFIRIITLEDRKLKFFFLVIFITFLSNIIIANNIYARHLWFPLSFIFANLSTINKEQYLHD